MSRVSLTDFRAGVDHAESMATRQATDLVKDEQRQRHQHLVAVAKNSDRSLAAATTVHELKETDLHDHAVVLGPLVQENERAHAAV